VLRALWLLALCAGVNSSLSQPAQQEDHPPAASQTTAARGSIRLAAAAPQYAGTDVGGPALAGSTLAVPGGLDVAGGGQTIGSTTDQFHFGWIERTGDFDLEVRVARVTVSDPFVHAGLMARDGLAANARFAGVFTSSPQLGCFFETRATAGANTTSATLPGGFPANHPFTWLRLRRSGAVFTGYASLDGQGWVTLGSATLSGLAARVNVGCAVSSENAARMAHAAFRDLGPTRFTSATTFRPTKEPPGPSSRRTGLVFSEIMYHPAARADGRNLEFVELYNARAVVEDLTGWRLSGSIDYRFPAGFQLQAGDCVVIAAAPDDFRAVYGITNVLGPYTNALPNDNGRLRLRNGADAIRLEVNYTDAPPWPVAPDGAGPSLVLARPSYGEDYPAAWAASEFKGGSPGTLDSTVPIPQQNVLINEFLAHTDDPVLDFIELYNRANTLVDLSGCILTDNPATNRFRIPDGTRLAGRGFVAWDQNQLGFRLRAGGETLYLLSADGARVLDAIRFGAQENGVSAGRSPDGAGTVRRLARPTPGAANGPWRLEDIVINEIMYHPISGDDRDEYLELYNRGASTVHLGGWRFVDGLDFCFPTNTALAAGAYLVVAKDAARLRANYPQLNNLNTVGDYGGSLSNAGERIALAKPDLVVQTNALGVWETNLIDIVVAEVTYGDDGRWGTWADGGGSSLELVDPRADPLRPANWADSDETQKAPWTTVEFTGRLDLGNGAANRLRLGMLGAGECRVDDIELFREGSTNIVANGDFEAGTTSWTLTGNHSRSTVDSASAYRGSGGLHIRSSGDGDTGINTLRNTLRATLANGQTATLRAKTRWLAGWPEVLFRLHGNWLEFPARLTVPKNLGTPALPNSRRVNNAGPAIYDVTHDPPLPRANEAVAVTCRLSDPDGVATVLLRSRVDPATTLTTVTMRDDGSGGDAVAGDGLYTGTIGGRSAGTRVAFRIDATDDGSPAATATFPANAPQQECLIRWEDTIPFGTVAHYHLWSTQATESARSNALDNTFRDATLVYGNFRVLYNVGFRDKGSPYHGGGGDFAVTVARDDPLLGATDRVFASTGNGGSEATGIRSQLAAWLGQQLGIPYLHAHYMLLYRNGTRFREIMEDLEQPNHDYAERWYPDGGEGDLYKVAIWFEFADDNRSFQSTGATIARFLTTGNEYKLARYRWNFQRRSNDGNASNYTNLFDLVAAMNDTSAAYVDRALNLADLEQWMRALAFNYAMGNWDVWTYRIGQNAYLYKQPGHRWVLIPWDIDFTFGLGDGTSAPLWEAQDPVMSRAFANGTFQRMLWRAYLDIVNGPFLPEQYQPQIDARRAMLLKNAISGLQSPQAISTFINGRRSYLLSRINATNPREFAITSNGGADFASPTPVVAIEGTAPFAVVTIDINGVPYPVTWTTVQRFRLAVPLVQPTNTLELVGRDRAGQPVPGAVASITVTYAGPIQQVQDFVVLNEVHYNPAEPNASFLELFNRSTTTPFDLSGFRLDGVAYTFPAGAMMASNSFLVLAKNRAAFGTAYGATIPVFDQYPGSLDNDGERIALVRPGTPPAGDLRISDVRYSNRLPWPTNAAGWGSSLQLVDPAQDTYRVGNWLATATNNANRVTPGRHNALLQNLAPFPPLWLNEVQPNNVTGPTDSAGDRDPWIELYNSGTNTLDLAPYYLTDSYTQLTRWQFPAGTTLQPGRFLLVWADGEPAEARPGEPHTNFRLNPTNGGVALVRFQGNPVAPAVMDYLEYTQLSADRTVGSYPDGEPRRRRQLVYATPGAANDPTFPQIQVRVNEFMALNTSTLADPADGAFDDWFELYNAGTNPADLSGYTLTDDFADPSKSVIPAGTIVPPGGFLLAWADEQTGQYRPGGDLHVNFRLAQTGEHLGLFSPDGVLVDGFSFGPQTANVSQGRYPDGADLPLYDMEQPTPRAPNLLPGGNRPPAFAPLPAQTIAEGARLTFTVQATDPDAGQTVRYSLGPDTPAGVTIDAVTGLVAWTPNETDGPKTHVFSVRATDNGVPPRAASQTLTVIVTEVNLPPALEPVPDQTVDELTLLALQLVATDPDWPANRLTFSLEPGAPEGLLLEPSGALSWLPPAVAGDQTYTVAVRVTDDGQPPASVTATIRVTVRDVPQPPDMPFIDAQVADEGTRFTLQIAARDPDTPPSPLRFSLDLAPPTATIDPVTGLLAWSPTELDGPGNAIFIVRVTEVNPPHLSATRTFSVMVNEVNQPPALWPLPDQQVREGATLAVGAIATDTDLPPQRLTYTLDPGAPAGLAIDAFTGLLAWLVGPDVGPSTNAVTVRVTDDGPGLLSDTQSFRLTVLPQPHVVINEIMHSPAAQNAQFVELLNNSSRASVDLGGLRLLGSNLSFAFPAGATLAPGQFRLVVRNRAAFEAAYGAGLPIAGEYAGALAKPEEVLRLVRPGTGTAGDEWLDEVRWSTRAPWPAAANSGASLQLIDALQDNSRVGNWAAVAGLGPVTARTLVAITNVWRYHQAGSNLGTAWREPEYNDATWPTGGALLYVENAALPAPKTTPLTLGPTTFYFRTRLNFTGPTAGVKLKLTTVIDDGAVFYLNGKEFYRLGIEPGATVAYGTFANRTVGDAAFEGPFTIEGDYLRPGDNVLAVEVHQVNTGSSDVVFGLILEAEGSAAPYTPGTTNSVAAALAPFPRLWLNELLVHNVAGPTDNAGEREPWIELYHGDPTRLLLEGWYLTDTWTDLTKWPFPNGFDLLGHELRLLWADGEPQETVGDHVHTGFRLAPTGVLALVRTQNNQPVVVDWLEYPVLGQDTSFGSLPDGQDASRAVLAEPTPAAANLAAPLPVLLDIGFTPLGLARFAWPSAAGRWYRVEYQPSLSLPHTPWLPLAEIRATGPRTEFTETSPPSHGQRYYRVVLSPSP